MAKKMVANNESKSKVEIFYGTKKEWVKAELNVKMSDLFQYAFNENVVVAEDEKGLYITGKSYVGAPILDPYRMYHRIVPKVKIENKVETYLIPECSSTTAN